MLVKVKSNILVCIHCIDTCSVAFRVITLCRVAIPGHTSKTIKRRLSDKIISPKSSVVRFRDAQGIGVAIGPCPPHFQHIQSFCALRGGIPNKIVLLAQNQHCLPPKTFWTGYATDPRLAIKVPLFPPFKFVYNFKMKDRVLCLEIKNSKASWTSE